MLTKCLNKIKVGNTDERMSEIYDIDGIHGFQLIIKDNVVERIALLKRDKHSAGIFTYLHGNVIFEVNFPNREQAEKIVYSLFMLPYED